MQIDTNFEAILAFQSDTALPRSPPMPDVARPPTLTKCMVIQFVSMYMGVIPTIKM